MTRGRGPAGAAFPWVLLDDIPACTRFP